ncbi:Heterokaryon incompatibility [Macrophomina phaseolina MS6]|uniref:Heterokaryon incompatibility n=1 Tax=Macrophomina phaseolina (strain MS6) TaxID=1126212 RepID=K2QN26_MACPH|nr:Heterokaryon incompatibility [Macrophomina phaseolina MS6]
MRTISGVSDEAGSFEWVDHQAMLHSSCQELREAASDGCRLCGLVLDNCLAEWRRQILPPDFQTFLHVRSSGLMSIAVNLLTPAASDTSLHLAAFWLHECLEKHPDCERNAGEQDFFPTRAIDVGQLGPGGDYTSPYLYDCNALGLPKGDRKYVALSHCWGPPQFHTLTTERANLGERRAGIPLESFPTSFRDAVMVTRKLGFRYLWIDSLCIIQQDTHDWSTEAGRMSEVYRQATFTIAAAYAWNSSMGCFVDRPSLQLLPFEIQLSAAPKPNGEVLGPSHPPALFTRAWVLQEQVLSSRMLVFDNDQVRWKCISVYASESHPCGGDPDHFDRHENIRRRLRIGHHKEDFFHLPAPTNGYWSAQHRLWGDIVINYTHRAMTNSRDRLVGLGGIAGAIQQQTRDTYVAGLWKSQLHCDLLWHIPLLGFDRRSESLNASMSQRSTRNDHSVAPSWSWASVTLPVSFGVPWATAHFLSPICTIEEIQLGVDSGMLKITGHCRILHVRSTYPASFAEVCKDSAHRLYEQSVPVTFDSVRYFPDKSIMAALAKDAAYHLLPGSWHPDEILEPETPITFVAIAHCPLPTDYLNCRTDTSNQGKKRRHDHYITHALGLIPVEGQKGLFRRVGHAEFYHCAWFGYCCDSEADATRHHTVPRTDEVLSAVELRTTGAAAQDDAYRPPPPPLVPNDTLRAPSGADEKSLASGWIFDGKDAHMHPVDTNPLPDKDSYHESIQIETRTFTIV